MFTNKIFLVLSTFGAFFISSIAIAQSNSLPNSVNPNVPEELRPPKEPTYKANSEKKAWELKSEEFIQSKLPKKAKIKEIKLKKYKDKISFKNIVNHDISPDRQIYEVFVIFETSVRVDGGRCLKDAEVAQIIDAETAEGLAIETSCKFDNFQYSHPFPGTFKPSN